MCEKEKRLSKSLYSFNNPFYYVSYSVECSDSNFLKYVKHHNYQLLSYKALYYVRGEKKRVTPQDFLFLKVKYKAVPIINPIHLNILSPPHRRVCFMCEKEKSPC